MKEKNIVIRRNKGRYAIVSPLNDLFAMNEAEELPQPNSTLNAFATICDDGNLSDH